MISSVRAWILLALQPSQLTHNSVKLQSEPVIEGMKDFLWNSATTWRGHAVWSCGLLKWLGQVTGYEFGTDSVTLPRSSPISVIKQRYVCLSEPSRRDRCWRTCTRSETTVYPHISLCRVKWKPSVNVGVFALPLSRYLLLEPEGRTLEVNY